MVGCNHWLSVHEFEHIPKYAEHTLPACNSSLVSQEMVKDRILAGCSPWSRKQLDTTYQLNNNKYTFINIYK